MNCRFEKCRNQGVFEKFYSGPFGLKQRGHEERVAIELDRADRPVFFMPAGAQGPRQQGRGTAGFNPYRQW